jgi:glycosyltransferase involved in cell wall biosynthesis
VLPNGVEVPESIVPTTGGRTRRALFLSRLHPKKGLALLVEAWARVRPEGWELVIAGPDERGHRALIQDRIDAAGLMGEVRFAGAVDDERKWALYMSADLVVLPTRSENFGLVVAEALGAGVPVLTTRGAPWAALERERCGWWVAPTAEGVADGLARATALPDRELRAMGERGRAFVQEAFGWPHVAREMLGVYRWVLGGGARPACLHVD